MKLISLLVSAVLLYSPTACSAKGQKFHQSETVPFVTTTSGEIMGKTLHVLQTDVSTFLGIPFAEPPIGELRFKKPIPVKKWNGVLKATEESPPCMQFSNREIDWIAKKKPSEDCLYLNIWVPGPCSKDGNVASSNLPVMVWIYGGGYYSGSSDIEIYDGSTIAAYGNVIVVSLNYRVGSFGFLSSGTADAPGNMGMLDQELALHWIKDNIRKFGGDPERITLFGESSGSVSVGLHIVSPMSRNLFKRAIMQSGSPYHVIFEENLLVTLGKGNLFASTVGCADDKINLITNPEAVMQCMRKKDAMQLAKVESMFLEKIPFLFTPISGDEFLPESPIKAINSGNFKKAEVLIGSNKDEGAIFMHLSMPNIFTAQTAPDLNLQMATGIIMGLFQNSTYPTPDKVAQFYLSRVAENDTKGILKAVYDSFGDFIFLCPSVFFAEKTNSAYYFFTHRPSNSKWGEWMGTTHFDEVGFVFGSPIRDSESYTPEEGRFSCNIIQKWTSFARNGLSVRTENEESWPKYSASNPLYLELNPKVNRIGRGPHTGACNFWREYFVGLA